MDEQALITERTQLWQENNALLDKNPKGLNAEQQAEFDKREARSKEIRDSLSRAEQNRAEERALKELAESRGRKTDGIVTDPTAPNGLDGALAFRGWAMGRHATDEMREAAKRCGVDINSPSIDMVPVKYERNGKLVQTFAHVRAASDLGVSDAEFRSAEQRAMSIGTVTAGGDAVPNEMMRSYSEVQKWYGKVRDLSQVITTQTGATLPWPTIDDTANSGRVLAEATAATTSSDPTLGVVNLGAYKFSSDAVLVSWELLQDSFIDIAAYLGRALGTRIGRKQNNKFTLGAGTTEPKGIITSAGTGKTAAATNAFTWDELIDLIHSLDPAYRNLPDTAFQVHDTTAAYLRKMKDGFGRYIWEPSTQVGMPDRIHGYPVYINNDMAYALTTGQKLVLFGNAKLGFLIRDAGATRFIRSDEKYVLEHQVMFEASQRSDCSGIDANALKLLLLA